MDSTSYLLKMRLKEFQTLKTASFVHIPFSTFWSVDNYVASATDKGVHIAELKFSGSSKESEIGFRRWFLKASNSTPTEECHVDVPKLMESLDLRHMFLLIQDHTLSPKAPLQGLSPAVKALSWSPPFGNFSNMSVLTVLTDLGSLDLYVLDHEDWYSQFSVSDKWSARCCDDWRIITDTDCPPETFNLLKDRTYKIKFTAFTWGFLKSKDVLVLFTCNMVGDIIIWDVTCDENELSAEVSSVIKTDLTYGTSLSCVHLERDSCLLLVCCTSGRMQCLRLDGNVVTSKSVVWSDVDQVQVPPNSVSYTVKPQGIIFIVPKGGFFLAFWLDTQANLLNFYLHNTEDIAITGMSWLPSGELLASSRNGDLFILEVQTDADQIDIKVDKVHPTLRTQSFICQGIAASKNSAIIILPYTVCAAYDHLVLKEQSHFVFTTIPDLIQPNLLLSKDTDNLMDQWDYLEILRLDVIQKNSEVNYNFGVDEDYDAMNVTKLKKILWLCKFSSLVAKTKEKTEELEQLFKQLKLVIISHYVFKYLASIKDDEETVSEMEEHSLPLMMKWLEMMTSIDPQFKSTKMTAQVLLKKISPHINELNEKCPFCDSNAEPVDETLIMKCSMGHQVPRCMKTLLPIYTTPYYICQQCGEVALVGIDDEKSCIICDGRLKMENSLK